MAISKSRIKIEYDRKRDARFFGMVGTAAEWSAYEFPLGEGEFGWSTDTKVLKVGDGTSLWDALPSISGGSGGSGSGSFTLDDGGASGDGDFILDDGGA